MRLPVDPVLWRAWCGVAGLLTAATLGSLLFHRLRPSPETRNTLLRVRTWWILAACLFCGMAADVRGLAVLLWIASALALKEFVFLDRTARNRLLLWVLLAGSTAAVYRTMLAGAGQTMLRPMAVAALAILAAALAAASGSLRRGGAAVAAFLLAGCGLACVPALALASETGGNMRPVFFLLLITGLNDVAQYLWGKSLGRKPVAPRISPRKTWAGLLGGVATTGLLAALLAPWLTPMGRAGGVAAGLAMGIGGFLGDLAASAYKRSVGAGASGSLLPGHGGMMDRVDSLCVTAPILYAILLSGWGRG
jgi:phosphatidate cytidylyltransferase